MRRKANSKKISSNPVHEESKQLQGETCGDSLKKSLATFESVSSKPKLLAWSSWNNKINIVEFETKKEFANFDGVKLNTTSSARWTLVKEIGNTGFLVNIHYSSDKSNLEVFDVSRKEQTKKIYSAEEVSGMTGQGDVTFSSRRGFLGATVVRGEVAYYLYNFDTSKSDGIVKLIRKSRWYSQYSTEPKNYITGLDFNPNGEAAATIDKYGVCLVSDVSTHSYHFHLNTEMNNNLGYDFAGRCKWSTNTDEPLLFVKYDRNHLNILDVEKKALVLKKPNQIELKNGITYWIDVYQSDGNMVASGGWNKAIKIFDKRESKIVQTFDGIHKDSIFCVRWSPSGDMIASASGDKTAAILDFKTGKKLYTGKTSDKENAMSVCFI